MASGICFAFLLFLSGIFVSTFAYDPPSQINDRIFPFNCSNQVKTCNALLYQHNGLTPDQIALYYSVKTLQISPIYHSSGQDYLVSVPCSCADVNGTVGYFYDTQYQLQLGDTFINVSDHIYSGQVWKVGGEETSYRAEEYVTMHLLCGCAENDSQAVVTYTVQQSDTVAQIANMLSAQVNGIENLNPYLATNPGFLDVGWLLYVPRKATKNPNPPTQSPSATSKKKLLNWPLIIGIPAIAALLVVCSLLTILVRRKWIKRNRKEETVAISKRHSSVLMQYQDVENWGGFESERPVVYTFEDIAEATRNFDESRKIGEGGYGCVYFGKIGKQEIAIKKMRSNKSKEFVAELKVLCKIHHINVVELLGYTSGDDHLYLVYEYVPNGSLNEHLHDPLLQGHQPLSWTARAQIALDSARGIEYIHDHTKSRYVHRDIKTSNILLDQALRAKVADFGLAKLVSRTSDEDLIATRLVGTPGYLPPESVKELQVTTKTDVFAFGVVLAELITGQRALMRDKKEPNKMRSLITILKDVFEDGHPESALEALIDGNLKGCYPMENVQKMAEISVWCLSEDATNRPEMREVVIALSEISVSSIEWEASLGGNSQVFSGVFSGR